MKVKQLVLKFSEDKNEFVFDEQINFVEDKKLRKTLEKTNIKNGNSSLIIKSMNDLPIYDVIQIKINVAETGVFLASFDKSTIDEKLRQKLIEKISQLKDDVEPTKETQATKIDKLITILDRFNPIYVLFNNSGSIEFNDNDYKNIKSGNFFAYPLLIIKAKKQPEKIRIKLPVKEKSSINDGKTEAKPVKERKEIVIDFPLFCFDYLFNSLFLLLFGFGTVAGIFELLNKESIAIFLLIITGVFLGISYYSVYSSLYKKHVERYRGLKYFLLIYIIVGAAVGIAAGYLICKYLIKTENEIDFSFILTISIPSVLALSICSILASKLINLIGSKIKK